MPFFFNNELLNRHKFHLSSVLFPPLAIWSHCTLHNHMDGLRVTQCELQFKWFTLFRLTSTFYVF